MAEEKKIAGAVTVQLVDNWRDWKRWWSLRWIFIAATLSALPEIIKEAPQWIAALPPDLHALLPAWTDTALKYATLASLAFAAASRVIAQKVPESTGPSVTQPAPADPPAKPPTP